MRQNSVVRFNGPLIKIIVGSLVLFVLVFILVATSADKVSNKKYIDAVGTALTDVAVPSSCGYCQNEMVGDTAEQIGVKVLNYVTSTMEISPGSEVISVQSITWDQVPQYNLGCLPDFFSIETPPMALVVIKGVLDPSRVTGKSSLRSSSSGETYVGLIMDLWNGEWVSLTSSIKGDLYSVALQDSDLGSTDYIVDTSWCTRSGNNDTYHYGETIGGTVVPDPTDEPPTSTPTPNSSLSAPTPIPTVRNNDVTPPDTAEDN